tara:strand:+ start:1698 stop:2909 length:1212 start_codon:yes stop_codon:yes gene_type:complete
MNDHTICDVPGPCWDGYIYVGPTVGAKGSCIQKEKLCKKAKGKGKECLKHIECSMTKQNTDTPQKSNNSDYNQCLNEATTRFENGHIKLCPRGYCTAKQKFDVYPSAYANGYASSVCKGKQPDFSGITKTDTTYTSGAKQKNTNLNRWFDEKWVNLCEKGDGPGGFKSCGTGKGVDSPENYPYCRAYFKKPGTKVVTVEELKKYFPNEFDSIVDGMCDKKRSLPQGVNGKPTRVVLPDNVYTRIKRERQMGTATNQTNMESIPIPPAVKEEAMMGLRMIGLGFSGGTQTGWDRAKQLAYNDTIDIKSLADMRTWFARHGPDATKGASYPGYCEWVKNGKLLDKGYKQNRGAVSWLIWGGDAAYKWLKDNEIRHALETNFPKRKISPKKIKLNPNCTAPSNINL